MTKTVFLHAGRAKTGTSAIQQFLELNEERLLERGYQYVRTGRHFSTHHPLVWCLHEKACKDGAGRYWKHARNYAVLSGSAEEYWQELRREIAVSDHPNFIISSEEFGVVLDLEPVFRQLAELTRDLRLRVVVYLRRQDEFLQAVYAEAVKGYPSYSGDFWQFVSPILKVGGADHRKFLGIVEECLGPGSVIPRIYEKQQFRGNIFTDFLASIGLMDHSGFTFPPRAVNLSLTAESLLMVRALNALSLEKPLRSTMVDSLMTAVGSKGPHVSHQLIPPRDRLRILEMFDDGNQDVARRYFGRPDGNLFLDPVPEDSDVWSVPFSSPERSVELLSQFARALTEEQHPSLRLAGVPTDSDGNVPVSRLRLALDQGRPIVVWGAGGGGEKTHRLLYRSGFAVKCFVDADERRWGSTLHELPICSPNILCEATREKPFVAIGSVFAGQIANTLGRWGYQEERDFWINQAL